MKLFSFSKETAFLILVLFGVLSSDIAANGAIQTQATSRAVSDGNTVQRDNKGISRIFGL